MKVRGRLIKATGIGNGNYMYWKSKSECDNWFLSKALNYSEASFDDYSVIRPDPNSKNGFNVAQIHLNIKYNVVSECDYVSFQQTDTDYKRWFHCQVIDREFVNENSTRLYIVIDYVATFYDLISLGECFVERTHVTDDRSGVGGYTLSKYLLSEPVSVSIRNRPDITASTIGNPFEGINNNLTIAESEYTLISSVSENGEVNNPEIIYQGGGAINGYVYNGDKARMKELLSKYVTFMSKMINKSSSFAEQVTSMYIAPKAVTSSRSETPVDFGEVIIPLSSLVNIPVKHAKVYDYFRVRVISGTGEVILSLAEYGHDMVCNVYMTGGVDGRATVIFRDATYNQNGLYLNSQKWARIGFAGSFSEKYELGIQGTNTTDFARYLQYYHGYNAGFPE